MTLIAGLVVGAIQAAQLTVGAGGAFATIGDAVRAARSGDTIRVAPGIYRERLTVDRPLVLLGDRGAIVDGGGAGIVIDVTAPATIRGFTIRGSGASQAREDAGIRASAAPGLAVENNRFEDVLFGVYVKQSPGVTIRRNDIVGKNVPGALRGDGIRLWYSHDGVIEENRVTRTRDVVIWFSNGTTVRRNVVTDSRYGLHYMYSNDNVFVGNRFEANEVGAFIMYSRRITFRENVFASARGPSGRGLGFKDSEGILAEDNVLVKNAVGISLDNSPNSDDVVNLFRRNVIAYNDVAVLLLPSVHSNVFTANEFVDNVIPLRVSGGGHGRANQWHGNYWSEYAGFDADGDGVGDRPFVFQRLSDDVLARHEALQLFALSPAVNALNTVSGVLPGLQPEPLLIDSAPRRSRWAAAVESPRGRGAGPVSLGLFGLATGALVVVARSRRSRSAS